MTADVPTDGVGTKAIPFTLTGSETTATNGRIVCMRKAVGGKMYWFVTSCEE